MNWLNFSYQKSSRYEKMGYEEEFSKFLLTLISDVDKRIRRGEQRLVLNSQPNPVSVTHANFLTALHCSAFICWMSACSCLIFVICRCDCV